MTFEPEKTKLRLDGRWHLEELSDVTKDYIQMYGFIYSLLPNLPAARREEVDYIYGKFPWRGGYSTVNFFNQLFHKIPTKLRPEIQRIRYASPGFIELQELLVVAVGIAAIVKAVCSSINMAHETYRNIQKGCAERKLTKIDISNKELELTQCQLAFCETQSEKLQNIFKLSAEQIAALDLKTQSNPAMKLKILLSVYRRVEPLAKQQANGKLKVTAEKSDET
ncbi:hypothetical protein [Desulfobulbus oligotrophicus]|uniref:Uncharacterized protein n=1 Tax=Desulfobulbus oligotrophicus TaxID=1909699 RepID=A0A7T5VB00_9BACT|nr:hypothetical protein [Desulfobulbus oligotrophicus]QQG64547.1 hypothetical protein HP555_01080 [Desulfobulbus oligotrophicus]